MGSIERHFNVSFIVKDKGTRHCSQTRTSEERGEPKRNRGEALPLTSLTPTTASLVFQSCRLTFPVLSSGSLSPALTFHAHSLSPALTFHAHSLSPALTFHAHSYKPRPHFPRSQFKPCPHFPSSQRSPPPHPPRPPPSPSPAHVTERK